MSREPKKKVLQVKKLERQKDGRGNKRAKEEKILFFF